MKKILLVGAGRSSVALIEYLIEHAAALDLELTIADANPQAAKQLAGDHSCTEVVRFDAADSSRRAELISQADLVISMLPAFMHLDIARDCLRFKKNLITPSYISAEMKQMASDVERAGIVFMNELGVDPGIDHMSAMRLLDNARARGAEITWYESFTGGLIAPESDDNPWNYKFTWNPRNVVLAGQGGTVKFKHNGQFKYIPYHKLFRRTEIIEIPGYGKFEGYANRDSLNYRDMYGLKGVPTIYRGTLRRVGFCRAWDVFIQLGMTDDSFLLEGSSTMTHRQFTNSFLKYHPSDSVELKLMHYMKMDQDSEIIDKLVWLGIFDDTPIGLPDDASPARILQQILEKKWTLAPDDKDMIVMWHKMLTREPGEMDEREWHSSLVVIGEEQPRTAMAKTVGLPVAIAAKMILTGKYAKAGVHMPMSAEIYNPILDELETYGIKFTESEVHTSVRKS